MIHQYKSNGYNIVMDVNSGSVHVVDDIVYDMIPLVEPLVRRYQGCGHHQGCCTESCEYPLSPGRDHRSGGRSFGAGEGRTAVCSRYLRELYF